MEYYFDILYIFIVGKLSMSSVDLRIRFNFWWSQPSWRYRRTWPGRPSRRISVDT